MTLGTSCEQEETRETGREGKGSCKKGFPRGKGAQRKQNKARTKTREEKREDSTDDAGGSYKVTVPKLSLIPGWSSSGHRGTELTLLVAWGWLG